MALQYPKQRRDVLRDVIDRFGPRALRSFEENPAHSHKRLGVCSMGRVVDDGGQAFCEVAFGLAPSKRIADGLGCPDQKCPEVHKPEHHQRAQGQFLDRTKTPPNRSVAFRRSAE